MLYYRVLLAGRIVRGINLVDKAKGGEREGEPDLRETAKMSKDCMQLCTRGAKLAKNVAAISKKTER